MSNPIDDAYNEGRQSGIDIGFARGMVLTLIAVLGVWALLALVGVMCWLLWG